MKCRTGALESGYQKISNSGEMVSDNDLCYLWVDTCCMDRSSSAELSEPSDPCTYSTERQCMIAYLSDVFINTTTYLADCFLTRSSYLLDNDLEG